MVGASARAAAHSLVRAGYAPWAVDLFADRDLRLVAPCVRCPLADYPAALPSFAEQFPPGPVLYTGGLENHPEVVAELARRRLVQGNNPDALRKARDPFGWYWRPARGYSSPLTRAGTDPVPTAGRWLSKPLRSAGGLGIRFADPGEVAGPERYVQEYIDGPSLSAQFVTLDGETTLLGVTDQLTGEPWLHAAPFAYCGTIGPTPVSRELRSDLAHFGRDAAGRAGLRGVWGADFVTRDGNPHPVEVNPRYTASMEVLEHATGVAVLRKQTPPPGPLPYEGRGRKTRADRCLPPP
ncbi:MAG: ATP-grasp domain-containing protein, partial [Gemmataceae bacterium]|nr:ATP-grasp domain-containing protein [Gemmataceae bacterium]